MRECSQEMKGKAGGGRGSGRDGSAREGWSEDELDDAEAGVRVFGTLMYAEEGEAKETRAYKKAQAAQAQNADKPVWQQEAVDAEGRRRLHGAFTGGFSAGYFNTVGSKEGWTPATFVSSRSNRAKIAAQRTEDFMDAEDLAEEATGGKDLETTGDFAGLGGIKSAPVVPTSLLVPDELLMPASDPVGLRLLRLMGWREGQGVGPRRKRVRGQDDGDEEDGEDGDSEPHAALHNFKFAPKDVKIFEAQVKDNLFGLGFDPLAQTPGFSGLLQHTSASVLDAQRKRGSAGISITMRACERARVHTQSHSRWAAGPALHFQPWRLGLTSLGRMQADLLLATAPAVTATAARLGLASSMKMLM